MTRTGSDVILQRLMTLHPKIIDLTLDRVWRILAALDHPERKLPPVIHLAGTNGKGSTLAMIRAGLEADGYRVHAYTSPHLARFHERIYLAGANIAEQLLADILDECEQANGGAPITYFEITTAAAFLAMSRVEADFVLLETGLGGRLDATNVIDRPAACIITPISIDHQQYLGETLPEIAGEKAGILKPGVTCIVGPQQGDALSVIEAKAAEVGAPLQVCNQNWQVWEEHGRMAFQDQNGLLDLPIPVLIGKHQVDNAGAVLATLRHLGKGDPEAAVTQAVWPARMQRLTSGALAQAAGGAELWLDGGHNLAAGQALAEALGRLPERPLYVICGMLKTKDVKGFLRCLSPHAKALYAVSIPGETATLSAKETKAAAVEAGMIAETAPTVLRAIQMIREQHPDARILICGSLYLAGEVLRLSNGDA